MAQDKKGRIPKKMLSHLSSAELRGRQSVRATFRLTPRAINAISILSYHLGIKQKSLFDHLIEDAHLLDQIAEEVEVHKFKRLDRTQKTFVLSRKTLYLLEQVSKHFDAPRDALVEYSILRLLPLIHREREKHQLRKDYFARYNRLMGQMVKLIERAEEDLGENDPISEEMMALLQKGADVATSMQEFIKRSEAIEDF